MHKMHEKHAESVFNEKKCGQNVLLDYLKKKKPHAVRNRKE